MNPSAATHPPTVGSLPVPGATLHYEVRGSGPLLALVGAPMDADSFAPLAELLAGEFTVLTADPRGSKRSRLQDPDQDSTPELRADDLSRLLIHLDAGPAGVLGSSGGAVTALALAQSHPELLDTVIAHEPPLLGLLADAGEQHAITEELIATHRAGNTIGAWTGFFRQANIIVPDGAIEMMFGGVRDPQQVADEAFWFAHELRGTTCWLPDLDALRTFGSRLIIGIGADSTDQLCERTSEALTTALGLQSTRFPGGHIGFADDPASFVGPLRAVLQR